MKKRITAAAGMAVLLLLTGCQSGSNNAETEALKEQVSQLEQQIAALEQQNATEDLDTVSSQEAAAVTDNGTQSPAADNDAQGQSPAADNDVQGQSGISTTRTIEELTSMVDAYVEKAAAAVPDGTASDNMEQFFSLKQEGKQVDNALDLHEDELETLYRQNTLTKDEYKNLEWELKNLEDKLDDAEDRLEYTFGIDD